MDACGLGYQSSFDVAKGFLHLSKESPGSGESECHRAQFAEDLVPLVYAYSVLGVGYGRDDFLEPRHAVGREGDCHVDEFNNPPDHGLARGS